MKNISGQYQDLKEGKMEQSQFLRNVRTMFPNLVTTQNSLQDSVSILKQHGMLTESDAVKGTPDKEPTYESPTPDSKTKYKKVEQSPEIDEQNGVYPATTLTDIPKNKVNKKVKNTSDGLEPIKDKDTKNEMKKVKIVKEALQLNEDELDNILKRCLDTDDSTELKAFLKAKGKEALSKLKEKVKTLHGQGRIKFAKLMKVDLDEARFKKGTDIGKKNVSGKSGFAAVAKAGAKEYGSKEAGQRVAGSILNKVLHKEGIEQKLNKVVEKLLKEVLAEKNKK
jgi:hypothetical protein